jgi:hypothetical protein
MSQPSAETAAPSASPSSLLSRALSLLLTGFAACAATTHVWHA